MFNLREMAEGWRFLKLKIAAMYDIIFVLITSFANKVSFYAKNTENTLLYDILYFKSFLGGSKEVDWS